MKIGDPDDPLSRIRVVVRDGNWLVKRPAQLVKPQANPYYEIPIKPGGSAAGAWDFDGNFELPTFSPSINESFGPFPDGSVYRTHYIVTAGRIAFCGDSTHELAGQTVDLPFFTELELRIQGSQGATFPGCEGYQ